MTVASTSPRAHDGDGSSVAQRQVSDYAKLALTVREMGLMRRRHGYYWSRFVLLNLGLVGAAWAFFALGASWWQLAVAAALALLLGQAMFLGHDTAHRQVFASGRWNENASLVLANVYCGMSVGWWLRKHNRHHAQPNQVGADPDIASGVLVFTTEDLPAPRRGAAAWFAARQGYLFFPLLLLEGLNLHVAGLRTVFGRAPVRRRALEITLVVARLGAYLAVVLWVLPLGMAAAFLGVQLGLFGLYMGAVFAPNHKGMPIVPADAAIDFLRRQVLMSRNIRGGRLTDGFMGGLNYQIEHHLFPTMPRPHLRRVQPVVQEYCAARGVLYTQTSLLRSYRIVIEYLNRVGLAARDPFQCPVTAQYRSAR